MDTLADGPPDVAGARASAQAARRNYQETLIAAIESNKFYPLRARRRRHEGVVELAITIGRDGTIRGLGVRTGSGHRTLDEAAQEAVRRIGSLPAPPLEAARSELEFVVPLEYRLR